MANLVFCITMDNDFAAENAVWTSSIGATHQMPCISLNLNASPGHFWRYPVASTTINNDFTA